MSIGTWDLDANSCNIKANLHDVASSHTSDRMLVLGVRLIGFTCPFTLRSPPFQVLATGGDRIFHRVLGAYASWHRLQFHVVVESEEEWT
jgi:hypothetical protein